MPTLNTAITFLLAWIFIGSVIWMLIYGSGIVAETRLKRMVRGFDTSAADVVLATAFAILGWPVVLWAYLRRAWR